MGVQTDVRSRPAEDAGRMSKDTALMMGNEVVRAYKVYCHRAQYQDNEHIQQRIAFGSLIEAARSEKQWKSQRAYLNILSEYFTYMTKPEKQLTVNFLYELLSHREGDIRRQAGRLMGKIIAEYDDVYRKEIPEWRTGRDSTDDEAAELWDTYLHKIVFPDYRVTDQHRSWIGYTLKVVMSRPTGKALTDGRPDVHETVFQAVRIQQGEGQRCLCAAGFCDNVPDGMFSDEEMISVLDFAERVSVREPVEIKIGALRVAEYISGRLDSDVTYRNMHNER